MKSLSEIICQSLAVMLMLGVGGMGIMVFGFIHPTNYSLFGCFMAFYIPMLISYVATNVAGPGFENGENALITSSRLEYCAKCQSSRQKRSHHCSRCNKCVLRMDHHCPWIGCCIGQHNYAIHFKFLCYCFLSCGLFELNGLSLLLDSSVYYRMGNALIYTLLTSIFVIFFVFVFILAAITTNVLHIIAGVTLIESLIVERIESHCRRKNIAEVPKFPFDMGTMKNFKVFLGESKLFWFVPLPSPKKSKIQQDQNMLFGDVRWPPSFINNSEVEELS